MKKVLALITLLIFYPCIVFSAEPFSVPAVSENEPIKIDSKRIEIERDKNKIFFYENVKVTQGDVEFFADKMIVNYKENKKTGKTEFSTIDAHNNVRFFSGNLTAAGESGHYNIQRHKFVVIGNVVINDSGAIVYGDRFEYDTLTTETKISGNKQGEGQVTIILDNIEEIEERVKETKKEEEEKNEKN